MKRDDFKAARERKRAGKGGGYEGRSREELVALLAEKQRQQQEREAAASQQLKSDENKGLPDGFFDSGVASEPATAKEGGQEAQDEPNITQIDSLPSGFFDDASEDAQARGIDVKKMIAKEEANDWKEFQAFAAEVGVAGGGSEEHETDMSNEDADADLDQMAYVGRVAQMLARSERVVKRDQLQSPSPSLLPEKVVTAAHEELQTLRRQALAEAPLDSATAAAEVSAMIVKKKRKRLQEKMGAHNMEYDALDWRAKRVSGV